ncbi:MAG TPA: hypothetical protein VN327_16150 [Pseudonocardiaceae bacterium]|nr:hypothetical protein [Pseudonocardiaceae bacterium]
MTTAQERADLAHVRWIGGGTGSGKTTVAQRLAERYDVLVYDGDAAERRYVAQASADKQPRLSGLLRMTVRQRWLQRTPQQIFNEMPSMNGETFPLILGDLRTWPVTRPVLVDDFRVLPKDVAALLANRDHAVFLLPIPEFRADNLYRRYADPAHARATWGDLTPAEVLPARLERDRLWDDEIRRQANRHGLPIIITDGNRSIDQVADQIAYLFRLEPAAAE